VAVLKIKPVGKVGLIEKLEKALLEDPAGEKFGVIV